MSKISYLNDHKIIKKIIDTNKSNEKEDDLIYLGSHSYSSMPGMSWHTEFWVEIRNDGKTYSLYCTDEESDDPTEKTLYEDFDAKGIIEYFEEIGFELSENKLKALNLS